MKYLPEKKASYVGAVIRDELFTGDKKTGLEFAQLQGEKPVLLIMGGSGGSEKINETIREALGELLTIFEIIHICGSGKVDSSLRVPGYAQFEYVHEELKDIFAATDFVVSRAGSNAIFEFLALRKPMLLIPLSRGASRGDQIINANSFKKKNYAKVLEEETLTTEKLIQETAALKKAAPIMLDEMKKNIKVKNQEIK